MVFATRDHLIHTMSFWFLVQRSNSSHWIKFNFFCLFFINCSSPLICTSNTSCIFIYIFFFWDSHLGIGNNCYPSIMNLQRQWRAFHFDEVTFNRKFHPILFFNLHFHEYCGISTMWQHWTRCFIHRVSFKNSGFTLLLYICWLKRR